MNEKVINLIIMIVCYVNGYYMCYFIFNYNLTLIIVDEISINDLCPRFYR